jgi:hypothetical protein
MNTSTHLRKYDVFFSYCHRDTEVVTKLAKELQQKGLDIFLDTWEVKLGDVLTKEIEKALSLSRAGVVFFSIEALKSPWVRSEYDRMITRAINDESFRLIPIRLQKCDIPGFAQDRLWLDLFHHVDQAIRDAGDRIIQSLGLMVRPSIGTFWSGALELADRLTRISESLDLIREEHRSFYYIIKL